MAMRGNQMVMGEGDGDTSYAAISESIQVKIMDFIRPEMENFIQEHATIEWIYSMISTSSPPSIRIVDFGCATGRNTLLTAHSVTQTLEKAFINNSFESPEFQVFFADLPYNDFNTLLRSLQPFHLENKASYYAACVCGSFHGRLFPKSSLHICHSSLSLHWLSNIPPQLNDQCSEFWNGGHMYISNISARRACLQQFCADFSCFLEARIHETMQGGFMFLALPYRSSGNLETVEGGEYVYAFLESCLHELAMEGLIEKDKIKNFLPPTFLPTVEEILSVVEQHPSLRLMGEVKVYGGLDAFPKIDIEGEGQEEFGRKIGKFFRCFFEHMLRRELRSEELVTTVFAIIEKNAVVASKALMSAKVDIASLFLARE